MDSNKIKKGLGRGLSSLIGETKVESQKNELSVSDFFDSLLWFHLSMKTSLYLIPFLFYPLRSTSY